MDKKGHGRKRKVPESEVDDNPGQTGSSARTKRIMTEESPTAPVITLTENRTPTLWDDLKKQIDAFEIMMEADPNLSAKLLISNLRRTYANYTNKTPKVEELDETLLARAIHPNIKQENLIEVVDVDDSIIISEDDTQVKMEDTFEDSSQSEDEEMSSSQGDSSDMSSIIVSSDCDSILEETRTKEDRDNVEMGLNFFDGVGTRLNPHVDYETISLIMGPDCPESKSTCSLSLFLPRIPNASQRILIENLQDRLFFHIPNELDPKMYGSHPRMSAARIVIKILEKSESWRRFLFGWDNPETQYIQIYTFSGNGSSVILDLKRNIDVDEIDSDDSIGPELESVDKNESGNFICDYSVELIRKCQLDCFFPFVGVVQNVKKWEILQQVPFSWLDRLSQLFPKLEHLTLKKVEDLHHISQAIWKFKELKSLKLEISVGNGQNSFPNLDSSFTGFSRDTVRRLCVKTLKNQRKKDDKIFNFIYQGLYQDMENEDEEKDILDEEFSTVSTDTEVDQHFSDDDVRAEEEEERDEQIFKKKLRVNSSIIDLHVLEELDIEFYEDEQDGEPEPYNLLSHVTGLFAFSLMPKLKIKISTRPDILLPEDATEIPVVNQLCNLSLDTSISKVRRDYLKTALLPMVRYAKFIGRVGGTEETESEEE